MIRFLPPEVRAKIAAGEVIERPASVVKELIENSLDAGAAQIHIEIEGGGLRSIKVRDDGCGIPPEEVELAFERFATSKISSYSDLEKITTLGFRGEALPSIAAVSELQMLTRIREEDYGIYILIREGKIERKEKRGAPPGTVVVVRDLFRNVPARLKFLKSPRAEGEHILRVVENYALAAPQVKFSLSFDGRLVFQSPGTGRLQDVAARIYRVEAVRKMIWVEEAGEKAFVRGLLSSPDLSRSNRRGYSFFVNGRWIQSRALSASVEEAYRGILPSGKYPVFAIHIFVPPQDVDVNVHPSKREVKLRFEEEVSEFLKDVIRRSLLRQGFHPLQEEEIRAVVSPLFIPSSPPPALPPLRILGQIQRSYIIAEGPDGIYFIDQHAAHERILFEKLRAQILRRGRGSLLLMEPKLFELPPFAKGALEFKEIELRECLAEFGFVIEDFGEGTWLIRAIPSILKGRDPSSLLLEILELWREGERERFKEQMAALLACRGAIRAGQVLSREEMEELLEELSRTSLPQICPHGRPVLIRYSFSSLEREFRR